jgi:hypothetical protein
MLSDTHLHFGAVRKFMVKEEALIITANSTPVAKALASVVKMLFAVPTKHLPLKDLRQTTAVGVLSYCSCIGEIEEVVSEQWRFGIRPENTFAPCGTIVASQAVYIRFPAPDAVLSPFGFCCFTLAKSLPAIRFATHNIPSNVLRTNKCRPNWLLLCELNDFFHGKFVRRHADEMTRVLEDVTCAKTKTAIETSLVELVNDYRQLIKVLNGETND